MSMERWAGRVALVTGASSGIGAAIARQLSTAGMKVGLAARRVERLETVANECDGETLVVELDAGDEASVVDAFAALKEKWGGTDVLINNAGLGRHAPLMSGSTDAWREMLEVNVLGLSICTREAVRDMHARGGEGHIIHVASMASHRVPPNSGMYSATKYAVRSLTEGLRQELREAGSKVRVGAVSPGFVETEFAAEYWGDAAKAKETYSRFRVLDADDVADAVVYMLGAPAHVQVHDVLMRPTEQRS